LYCRRFFAILLEHPAFLPSGYRLLRPFLNIRKAATVIEKEVIDMSTWHNYVQRTGSLPPWPYPINYGKVNEVTSDVLIVGGGVAGCHAAVAAAKKGVKVALAERGHAKRSGSGGAGVMAGPFCSSSTAGVACTAWPFCSSSSPAAGAAQFMTAVPSKITPATSVRSIFIMNPLRPAASFRIALKL